MGIIRSDTIDTSYGDSISNCYMAIADQSIEIRREQDVNYDMDGAEEPFQPIKLSMPLHMNISKAPLQRAPTLTHNFK